MGLKPKIPAPVAAPAAPPPLPNELDPAVKKRRERFRGSLLGTGRQSTVLTSPQGLPSKASITEQLFA